MSAPVGDDRLEAFRAAFDAARGSWAEEGETSLETGLDYRPGEPVLVSVRKRDRRWDLDDGGRAASLAGKPEGWLAVAERTVAAEAMNVNPRGRRLRPGGRAP